MPSLLLIMRHEAMSAKIEVLSSVANDNMAVRVSHKKERPIAADFQETVAQVFRAVKKNEPARTVMRDFLIQYELTFLLQAKPNRNIVLYMVSILEQLPPTYADELRRQVVQNDTAKKMMDHPFFKEEVARMVQSGAEAPKVVQLAEHQHSGRSRWQNLIRLAGRSFLILLALEVMQGQSSLIAPSEMVHANVMQVLSPALISPHPPEPAQREVTPEAAPEFIAENGMLFIRRTPDLTYEKIVNEVIPRSPFRQECQTLNMKDFDQDPARMVAIGEWINIRTDANKQKIPMQVIMRHAEEVSSRHGNRVPWQLLVAICLTESDGMSLYRQEFNQAEIIQRLPEMTLDPLRKEAIQASIKRYGNIFGGSVGIAQVMPSTALYFGHKGPPSELHDPRMSLFYAEQKVNWILSNRGDIPPSLELIARRYTGSDNPEKIEWYALRLAGNIEKLGTTPDALLDGPALVRTTQKEEPVVNGSSGG